MLLGKLWGNYWGRLFDMPRKALGISGLFFFGNFVQQKGDAKSFLFLALPLFSHADKDGGSLVRKLPNDEQNVLRLSRHAH